MSRLQPNRRAVLQPDVPNLIHDVILSLCQRKYADVSDVEVDGIICISFNGLSEQQVIKIHENLPSAQKPNTDSEGTYGAAITDSFNEAAKTVHRLNELDLQLEVENVNEGINEKDENDDKISNTLPDTENEPKSLDSNNYRSDISFLSSILKTTNDIMNKESNGVKKKGRKSRIVKTDSKDKVASSSRRKRKHPIHHPIKGSPKKAYTDESLTDSRAESNDFSNEGIQAVHPTMVVIKQEPLDDSDETNPKIVDVFSTSNGPIEEHSGELATNERSNEVTINSENHGALSVRQNQEFSWKDLGMRRPASRERSVDWLESKENEDNANKNNMDIVIKQEIVGDEYENACGENIDHGHNNREMNNGEYPDFFHIANYFEKENDNQESENSSEGTYTSLKKSKSNDKNESAASKKWFETVKKNMNKYQAALLKSVQITKKGSDDKGCKPSIGNDRRGDHDSINDPEDSPVLKHILDTSPTENVHVPERDTPSDITIKKETASVSEAGGEEFGGARPKLTRQYPALFNQLKKSEHQNQNDLTAQSDSLVNRLPFLSFKDLFAQASPNTPAPNIDFRPSPERLANLLSQPLKSSGAQQSQQASNVSVFHPGTPARRGWNWRKRAVRPKGPNGEILTHLPPMVSNKSVQKPVGIANPKRQKPRSSKDKDTEWRPHHGEERQIRFQRDVPRRSSSGRSRRTNFTEYSESDVEEIETEQDEADNDIAEMDEEAPIQMVSAYCKNNCGSRFDSVEELSIHEETCNHKGFTCEACGLDFVQQYRWQYHMIKVHGISVDSAMFR